MKKEVAKSCLFIYSEASLREAFIKLGIIFAALKIVVVEKKGFCKNENYKSYSKSSRFL